MGTCYIYDILTGITHILCYSSAITYIRLLWVFLPCKSVYDDITYRYTCEYATDFMNIGIKLLNTDMKETENGHKGGLVE
jgi:hypothetical protein